MNIWLKISQVAIIAICVVAIGGCGTPDYKKTDGAMKTLVKAIENEDKEAIKSIFSETALEEAEDLDARIDSLFELGGGRRIEWKEDAYGEFDSKDGDFVETIKKVRYIVTIGDQEYLFFLVHYLRDDNEPKNIGIYMIQALHTDNYMVNFDWGEKKICPGIYPVIGKGD